MFLIFWLNHFYVLKYPPDCRAALVITMFLISWKVCVVLVCFPCVCVGGGWTSLPLVQYIACQKCDYGNNIVTVHCCEGSHPSACLNHCTVEAFDTSNTVNLVSGFWELLCHADSGDWSVYSSCSRRRRLGCSLENVGGWCRPRSCFVVMKHLKETFNLGVSSNIYCHKPSCRGWLSI